jgi:hypothetical protein
MWFEIRKHKGPQLFERREVSMLCFYDAPNTVSNVDLPPAVVATRAQGTAFAILACLEMAGIGRWTWNGRGPPNELVVMIGGGAGFFGSKRRCVGRWLEM